MFLMADGAPLISSGALALAIVDFVRINLEGVDANDEGTVETKQELVTGAETLSAMMWASENGGLTPIQLRDISSDPILNQMIRNVKNNLGDSTRTHARNDDESVPDRAG